MLKRAERTTWFFERPKRSCCNRENVAKLGSFLPVLDLIRKRAKNEGFDLRNRLLLGRTISHGSSQHGDLSDPTTILFFFDFHFHEKTLAGN